MERRRLGRRGRDPGPLSAPARPPARRTPISPWPVAGLVGLACVAFLIGATSVAVAAPRWAFAGLALVWLVALALAVAWFVRRPRTVALLPVVVAVVWFATVVGGARYLGWS
ncbi:hypothetical protein [Nocardioides xinjiangensis]|uniref:hypothetical protein n=1 Tax=Nocardioides xinjiangensis TaxID=2817376 RepID=UPI001B31846E|nr:hypothetical protein [Nocardioides sp. SYSU D00514]